MALPKVTASAYSSSLPIATPCAIRLTFTPSGLGAHTFKVYSTGLEVGDTIKVKAGFRYYSSLAEKEIEVV